MVPEDRSSFRVAIICALPRELSATLHLLDRSYPRTYGKALRDPNTYTLGEIGLHPVVITVCSEMGKVPASNTANGILKSFPNIELCLLVGICGAVPNPKKGPEIFLGEVVIGDSIYEFDRGRTLDPGTVTTREGPDGQTPLPHNSIQSFLSTVEAWKTRPEFRQTIDTALHVMSPASNPPAPNEDRLFPADYIHKHQEAKVCVVCNQGPSGQAPVCERAPNATCDELKCDVTKQKSRSPPPGPFQIHMGRFGTSDAVMRSGLARDKVCNDDTEGNIIAFEMEAAGVWRTLSS